MYGQPLDDQSEPALKKSPIESKPEMPGFATEELVGSSMELNDITVDQSNDLVEVGVFWECRL